MIDNSTYFVAEKNSLFMSVHTLIYLMDNKFQNVDSLIESRI